MDGDSQRWVDMHPSSDIRDIIRDTVQLNPAKRKRVAHSPLRVPGSGSLQTRSSSSRRSARPVSFASEPFDPPPPRGSSLVCMYGGGESLTGG